MSWLSNLVGGSGDTPQQREAAAAVGGPVLGLVAVGLEHHPRAPGVFGQPSRLRRELAIVKQGNELMPGAAVAQVRLAVAR